MTDRPRTDDEILSNAEAVSADLLRFTAEHDLVPYLDGELVFGLDYQAQGLFFANTRFAAAEEADAPTTFHLTPPNWTWPQAEIDQWMSTFSPTPIGSLAPCASAYAVNGAPISRSGESTRDVRTRLTADRIARPHLAAIETVGSSQHKPLLDEVEPDAGAISQIFQHHRVNLIRAQIVGVETLIEILAEGPAVNRRLGCRHAAIDRPKSDAIQQDLHFAQKVPVQASRLGGPTKPQRNVAKRDQPLQLEHRVRVIIDAQVGVFVVDVVVAGRAACFVRAILRDDEDRRALSAPLVAACAVAGE